MAFSLPEPGAFGGEASAYTRVVPELPDILTYVAALDRKVVGQELLRIEIASPFVLRTVEPTLDRFEAVRVVRASHLGKRIVLSFEGDLYLLIHLMIAGRLHWRPLTKSGGRRRPTRAELARFEFADGCLCLTEAGTKRRASLHALAGGSSLREYDRGGLDVLAADEAAFVERLSSERHTLKRALTDPRLVSGIGNAYSDEILHRACLSPFKLTTALTPDEASALFEAVRSVLLEWIERLRLESGDGFPEKVTPFRPEMAVHGRFGQPCPRCAAPVQRIVYASNESNYCARCQNAGRLLADRALSRLLKQDWPRTLDELEQRREARRNRDR